jgi:hypothetical protein
MLFISQWQAERLSGTLSGPPSTDPEASAAEGELDRTDQAREYDGSRV